MRDGAHHCRRFGKVGHELSHRLRHERRGDALLGQPDVLRAVLGDPDTLTPKLSRRGLARGTTARVDHPVADEDRLGVRLVLATEDGSAGTKGRITLPLEEGLSSLAPNEVTIYACGPEPMLAAVAKLAVRYGQPSEVSMERTMGCGLGGCYSCVVPVMQDDGTSRFVRSCIGGPVFDGAVVAWD